MKAVIIGDGLTRDFLSSELPYRDSKLNVGQAEIDRLLGKGKQLGMGPLPMVLREALESRARGADLEILLMSGCLALRRLTPPRGMRLRTNRWISSIPWKVWRGTP